MAEVKYRGKSPEQRINDRTKNSAGDLPSDVHVVKGTGPLRTHTNVFHSGTAHGSTTKQRSDYEKGSR
jgi:hypothetical protein